MLSSADAFNQNIGGWNTASVTTMYYVCSMPSHADMRAHHPWQRLEPRALCALRLVHVCARLARFGAYGTGLALVAYMLAVRLADVQLGVGVQPEHRRLEHGERDEDEFRMPHAIACKHAG